MFSKLKSLFVRSAQPQSKSLIADQYAGTNVLEFGRNYVQDAGVQVDQYTALALSVVNSCIRRISSDIAILPRPVYQKTENGREKATSHQVHRLLNHSPNEFMTPATYVETIVGHLLEWGNHYSFIDWQGNNILGLYPIPPWLVWAVKDKGRFYYHVEIAGGIDLDPSQVLHVVGFSFDGLRGRSPIEDAAQVLGIGLALDKFAAKYFSQGTNVNMYLHAPAKLTKDQKAELKQSMEKFKGLEGAHGVPLFEGVEPKSLSAILEQCQFLGARQYQAKEICRLFLIHPSKIGENEGMKYNNLELTQMDYVQSTLMTWIVKIEEEVNRKLFLETEKENYYMKINADAMMRGDKKSRFSIYDLGLKNGIYDLNDVLLAEDLNTIGELGEMRFSQLKLAPLTDATTIGNSTTDEQGKPADELQDQRGVNVLPLIQDAKSRLRTKEVKAVERAWKKFGNDREAFLDWSNGFFSQHRATCERTFQPLATLGVDTKALVEEHLANSTDNLIQAVEDGEVEQYIISLNGE